MKVTHVIDSGGYYGAEVMLVHLCQAQQQTGMDVEVISIGTLGNYKKPLEEKLEEHGIRYIPWRMRALPDLRESFRILKHCKQGGSDVIHSHGYKGNILLGLIPRRLRKIPVITTVHGYTRQSRFSKMTIYQWLDKLCLPRLDAVVIVSEGMRHQIPEKKLGSKLHVVANGIPENSSPSGTETIDFFKNSNLRIGAIGRLSHEKNFQLIINAMPKIIENFPSAKLAIYGEGQERGNLEQLIETLGLQQYVTLPGYISNPTSIYAEANIFVNCSLTEGMPITILEALRAGCAIVATNIVANRVVLSLKNESVVVCGMTPDDLSNAVLKIEKFSHKKNQLLKKFFLANYTSEKSANNYFEIYKKYGLYQ